MRVTFSVVRDGLAAIERAAEQLAEAQRQVSSGLRIQAPSDDPAATQRAILDSAEIARLDSYSQASDTAYSRLTVADNALSDLVNQLTAASSTVMAALGNTADAATRTALSEKLAGIRDAIAGDINTTFRGTYLFAGGEVGTRPYEKVGSVWVYNGDNSPVTVAVGPTRTATISRDGEALLKGSDSQDILTTLEALITAVGTGDQATLEAGVEALSGAFSRATAMQSQIGVDESGIDTGRAQIVAARLAATTNLSQDRDADMAAEIVKMNQAQNAYQAALGVAATAQRETLFDYLK